LEVTSGRFESFSSELTRLVTKEPAELTGAVGLANMEELVWPTRVVGLLNLATVERESA
jgi:hypothetical protein